MKKAVYLMVTSFSNHWDKIPNKRTQYPASYLRKGMSENKINENNKTIFLKINKDTKDVESAWEGRVSGFKKEQSDKGPRICFDVEIEKSRTSYSKYKNYTEGWHLLDEDEIENVKSNILNPPFFEIIKTTKDSREFEKNVSFLLKLIGINNIYVNPPENQPGKADGFFWFRDKLAVMYDCTLRDNFKDYKKDQIDNFCSQLKKSTITFGRTDIYISPCDKQVWIITKGHSTEIKKCDDIIVKEVPISKLFEIYSERLDKQHLDEDEIREHLKQI